MFGGSWWLPGAFLGVPETGAHQHVVYYVEMPKIASEPPGPPGSSWWLSGACLVWVFPGACLALGMPGGLKPLVLQWFGSLEGLRPFVLLHYRDDLSQ